MGRRRGVYGGLQALVLVLCLCAVAAFGQNEAQPTIRDKVEKATFTFVTNGDTVKYPDYSGTITNKFEITPLNAPGTLTANVFGCMRGTTCSASPLATSSGTGNQVLTVTGPFDYYNVTTSWTAQSNGNGVTINRTGIPNAGGGAGTNVAITGPVDGSNNVKVNCITGCSGSNPNGQAAMAASAPVVIASNQSAVPVTGSGNFSTQPGGFASVLGGQQTVTASAVVLPTNSTHGVCVKALSTNTIDVFVGPAGVTTSTGFPLSAGDSACYQLSNTNLLFVIASTTGASISWTAN